MVVSTQPRFYLASEQHVDHLVQLDTLAQRDPKREEDIKAWVEARNCYLCESDGEVVGYGVLTRSFFGHAFIEMVMISEKRRRSSLGTALVSYFQALSQGSKLFTSTNTSNLPMQYLLLKTAFKPSGYIENLDPDDPELIFFYTDAGDAHASCSGPNEYAASSSHK
ncbi:GNAT family N-acetyltransferase [Oryzifoliimicrobium ureilyticus]|uniref:GNAT family N-acetyltransferase n=1 Tax=Oryzifoliimicrobium ureilyticus TaxID=3113724 RepID=UPI0030762B71